MNQNVTEKTRVPLPNLRNTRRCDRKSCRNLIFCALTIIKKPLRYEKCVLLCFELLIGKGRN